MEGIVHNFQDKMDMFEEQFDKELENIFKKLKIEDFLDDPLQAFLEINEVIKDKLDDKYPLLVKNGIKFAEKINAKSQRKKQDRLS